MIKIIEIPEVCLFCPFAEPSKVCVTCIHVWSDIGEMSMKYSGDDYGSSYHDNHYVQWANTHKTMILLNGGMSENLLNILEHFDPSDNPYAWDYFRESTDALDCALTCVGIILPDRIYVNAQKLRSGVDMGDLDAQGFDEWEQELYTILNSCKLT